jgi:hypothetical protein
MCHCGEIQYSAEVDASNVLVCHCTDCQVLTGSAFRINAPAKFATFVVSCGVPSVYEKVAESGSTRHHGFCGRCGTPLYSVAPGKPELVFLRVGAIVQRDLLYPSKQIWCRSSAKWLQDLGSMPGSNEQQALIGK